MEKNDKNKTSSVIELIVKLVEFYITNFLVKNKADKTAQICTTAICTLIPLLISCGLLLMIWCDIQIMIFIYLDYKQSSLITTIAILMGLNLLLLIITSICFIKLKNKLISYFS
jgi:hypothetical protein